MDLTCTEKIEDKELSNKKSITESVDNSDDSSDAESDNTFIEDVKPLVSSDTELQDNYKYCEINVKLEPNFYDSDESCSSFVDESTPELDDDLNKELIKLVQSQPILYDDTLNKASESARFACWKRISNQINRSVEECQQIWDQLSTFHAKLVQRTSEKKKIKRWKYFDDMNFFVPFCKINGVRLYELEQNNFKEKLITLIRDKYPQLYDTSHPKYTRYSKVRILTWRKVGEEMNCRAETCRKIWADLRLIWYSNRAVHMMGRNSRLPSKFIELMDFINPFVGTSDVARVKSSFEIEDEAFKKKLALTVKEYPQLYDSKNYNLKFRERIIFWNEIAKRINSDGQKCQKTWAFLRHHYSGLLRRRKLGFVTSWKFEKDLDFLLPHIIESVVVREKFAKKKSDREIEQLNLIQAVQRCPQLYDFKNYPSIKDHPKMWQKVSKELSMSVSQCRRTWTYLRRLYRKTIRAREKGEDIKPWHFEKDFEFLRPFIIKKKGNKVKGNDMSSDEENIGGNYSAEDSNGSSSRDDVLHSEEFIINLLQTIAKYKVAYSHFEDEEPSSQQDYQDAWDKIAEEVQCPVFVCCEAWEKLKAMYKKSCKARNERWKYEDNIQFAKAYILGGDYQRLKRQAEEDRQKTSEFRSLLIETVKKYPEVFDECSSQDLRKINNLRKIVWKKIAMEVNHSVKGCFGLWNSLVSSYKKSLIKTEDDVAVPFEFRDQMEFLRQYVEKENEEGSAKPAVYTAEKLTDAERFKKNLIRIVKRYPELYDCEHKKYRKGCAKARWITIAKEMNSTAKRCSDVWAQLRANYKVVLRRRKHDNYRRTKFEDDMEFLQPFLIKKLNTDLQKEGVPENNGDDYRFKLIDIVKDYPQLYDSKYMTAECGGNWQQRRLLWNKIAEEINRDVDVIRDDWKLLKRTLKVLHSKKTLRNTKWKFKNSMEFMLPFIEIENPEDESPNNSNNQDFDSTNEMDVFRRKLIELVKAEPELLEIRDTKSIMTIWKKISEQIGETGEFCRMHWWRLKTAYRDYLIKKSKNGGAKWKFADDMEFMLPHTLSKIIENEEKSAEMEVADKEAEIFKKNLIECVKKYPELYDYEHENFGKLRVLTKTTWEQIAAEVGRSSLDCRLTWNALKYHYRKLLKGEMYNNQNWKFQSDMEFMLPFIFTTINDNERDFNVSKYDKHGSSFTLALIEVIKTNFPIVYDNSGVPDEGVWQKIGEELDRPPEECQDEWDTLKKCYTTLVQSRHSGYNIGVKWTYEEEMTFLDSYLPALEIFPKIENKRNKTYARTATEIKTVDTNVFLDMIEKDRKNILEDNSTTNINDNIEPPEKKLREDLEKTMVASTDIMVTYIKMARAVEKLPHHNQEAIKQKVYTLVMNAKKAHKRNVKVKME